jgi:hypothetical protein
VEGKYKEECSQYNLFYSTVSCGLPKDAVSISDYIALNGRMTGEQ